MINSCQVREKVCKVIGRIEICRYVISVRRRQDGTMPQWCLCVAQNGTKARLYFGNAPSGTIAQ